MSGIRGVIVFLFFGVLLVSIATKYLWSYLAVRLFPGAVEQNLIARDISWKDSIIIVFIIILISQG